TCIQSNGSVTSFVNGGTAPYTFLWTNGATTQNLSNVPSGSYNIQITDAVGCLGSGWVFVGASTPISVTNTVTASSCTAATGSATITATGGVGPYTVLWYTFPTNSTGISISNKPPGNYQFKVTASNGCIQTGSALIPPVSSIVAGALGNSPVCPVTTGNVQTFVSGSNPPFSYAWSTGATTSSITGVGLGYYSCTITDALGCSKTVGGGVTQSSPINIGFNATPATCIFSNNGSLFAAASGGLPPYTYNWGTQTGQTATGLSVGLHGVIVTDANGCSRYASAYVGNSATSNSCFCTITGTVFTDANANCVQNMGEAGLPNVQIHCSGIGYVYTDAAGAYSFMVPSGSYTITQSVQQIYPLATCQNNNIVVNVTAASNCVNVVNFANNIIPIHDLQIITSNMNPPVPGNAYTQKVIIQNNGSIIANNIKLGYRHDGQLAYNSNSNWALTQPNAGVPTWFRIHTGFPSLNPGGSSSAFINYNVPTNIPLSTQVNCFDTVAYLAPIGTNWLVDNTPWTNVNSHQAYVIGSYDPNFKEVQPRGVGAQGDINKKDSVLTYIVHFQNTGSYFAQNIVVVDTLDANLNLKTMRPGYSDHKYTVTMSDNGVAKFTFSNINLPWKSSYGDIGSSGMFTYSIRLKSNLALGTKIRNKAAIYFDYNAPIITNTTINTLVAPNGLKEFDGAGKDRMLLYPNPAGNNFTLVYNSSESINAVISIIDISGRVVLSKEMDLIEGENTLSGNTSSLQNGVYFVQVKTINECYTKKLLISK
ncbi:MAG: T9SS type A sorting domain-containing protein, partial [Bacteroidia bacterium]|nr:T9SS type A sorting domain-containing protein [Bacteroidia bacterium]